MKKLLLSVIVAMIYVVSPAQHHDHERCGNVEYIKMLKEQDPGFEARMEQIEEATRLATLNKAASTKSGKSVVTIPVVFHVIYRTSAQNISSAQINSQLDVLNKDYRRLNSDTSNTPSVFASLGADFEIEFCLAQRDPNGNPTTGITRTQTSVFSFSIGSDMKYNATGGHDIWNRDKYLNIWVCSIQNGILGFATPPGSPAGVDGVVIGYEYLGTMGTAQWPFNLGRTATHEVGHWFNLKHIWGDDNGACTGSDLVGDTPNQDDSYYNCPNHPQYSCGSNDMFMNYMDYVNDNCMNIFTEGQKQRAQYALNNFRPGLLTSEGCSSVTPVAAFSASETTIPPTCSVDYTDLSTGMASTYEWIFDGGSPATSNQPNPVGISYANAGTFDVTMIVSNVIGSDTMFIQDYITVSSTLMPSVDFWSNKRIVCTGENVEFFDVTEHCPGSWTWTISPSTVSFVNGTNANSQNPVIVFNDPGKYSISLEAANANGGISKTEADYITAGGVEIPFKEGFELDGFKANEWVVENPDNDIVNWDIVNVSGAPLAENKAAKINIYGSNSLGTRDRLISPAINLNNLTAAWLSFHHAYAQYETSYTDSLNVFISDDCGSSWTKIFQGGDDGSGNFATHTPTTSAFVPASADDWCGSGFGSDCNVIDISSYTGSPNIKVMFESVSAISNNIYIDNFKIANIAAIGEVNENAAGISLYPNPTSGDVNIVFRGLNGKLNLEVLNLQGQVMRSNEISISSTNHTKSFDFSDLESGIYFLRSISAEGNVDVKRLIIR